MQYFKNKTSFSRKLLNRKKSETSQTCIMIEEVEAWGVVNLITNTALILKPNLILGGTGKIQLFLMP